DYYVDDTIIGNKLEFMEYTVETNDDNIIKQGETITINLNITFKTELDSSKFTGNLYNDSEDIVLLFSNDESPVPKTIDENPKTGVRSLLFIIPIVVVLGSLGLILNKKYKMFKVMSVLAILIIPTISGALSKYEIQIESNIQINNCRFKFKSEKGSFDSLKDVKEICINDAQYNGPDHAFYPEDVLELYNSDSYELNNLPENAKDLVSNYALVSDKAFRESGDLKGRYIRIYSDKNKTRLIKEITKKDFEKYNYNVIFDSSYIAPSSSVSQQNEPIYTRNLYAAINIGNLTKDDVYIEYSPDIDLNDYKIKVLDIDGNVVDEIVDELVHIERGYYQENQLSKDYIVTYNTEVNDIFNQFVNSVKYCYYWRESEYCTTDFINFKYSDENDDNPYSTKIYDATFRDNGQYSMS
ncbi:MAG: hypothetical protein K5666_02495, partial [Bacilli bacterium]|nr:hypothetical protein [Bacilli bacterium]